MADEQYQEHRFYQLQLARKIARERGGKCLSKEYKNNKTKLHWECVEKHRWWANLGHIKDSKSWCPTCGNGPRTALVDVQAFVAKKGGECLATKKYIGIDDHVGWRCEFKHEWIARFRCIKYEGTWCPHCKKCAKHTIETAQEFAKTKNGECLSTIYVNAHTKLRWRCEKKHEWEATLANTKNNGHWCPECSAYKTEREVRTIIEEMTEHKFPKTRGLLEANSRWELDGYCEELNIGFEFHGAQHYRYVEFFHKTIDAFKKRVRDDGQKVIGCRKAGIDLIVIPYHVKDRKAFIRKKLDEIEKRREIVKFDLETNLFVAKLLEQFSAN